MRPSHRSLPLAVAALLLLPAGAAADEGAGTFPFADLLPKSETGAAAFLEEHPQYDGRGVLVAVLDTGVDPGAPGMQVTTDGKPKIVDLVDGSGSGDVVTTTVRRVEDGVLLGLTGRELTPGEWANPSGEYRLGVKPAWELYPRALVRRLKTKRREAWDETQRERIAEARRAVEAWDAANPSPNEERLRERQELVARRELLETMQDDYDDPGPVFDCVVFHDGEHWRGVVDTDEDGDLGDERAMANFRVAREWFTFDDESLLNFGVNVYDDGNVLSIVADCGAHGTHVAGIVAANYPDRPELNGVAPGAQIVAVKIGDTRLGASSMGTGPARAVAAVLENGCDVVNMSYGGSSPLPDAGHTEELYQDLVYERGVTFVSTSGNEGPALSTAGSPGGTTSALIGVGAYISGDMMTAQYSLREKLPDTQYTWSSRGPTLDGALGVDFSAPGGAVAPVPNWSLQPNTLMNGTSMAAPSVAGGIACLISGLKERGVGWTPQQIKRALMATAAPVEGVEPWALGQGLVRIDRAWDRLLNHPPYSATGLRFDVSIAARGGARGIYLREPGELIRPTEVSVGVDPSFRRDVDNREKVDFQMQASLAVDADWVQVPAAVHLHGGGRNFRVLVDPRGLEPGAHYAEITGTDLADPGRGPVFRVPVTVVVPGGVPADDPRFGETLSLRPGQIHRRFLAVPEGATWADIMVRSRGGETERHLVLHTVQLEPGLQYDLSESQLYAWVAPGEDVVRSIPVLGGRTLEVTVAHYWSSLGQAEFEWDITFHGLVPTDRNLFLDGAHPSRRTAVTATLRDEVIEPEAKLTRRRITLRPADWELRPLPGDRDLLPEGKRIHELVLTYEFEREKAGRVLPVSTLNDDERFWEYWESGLWMILDEGKQRLFTGPVEDPVILPEGKYTLRYQLRHHDVERLEGTVAMPLHLDEELTSPITLAAFSDAEGAFGASASLGSPGLVRGEMRTFWISSPSFEKLPEGVESGNLLLGTITYGQERPDRPGAGRRPGGYPLAVRVPTEPVEKKEPEAGTDDEKGGDDDRLAADVHDTMLELLARLRKDGRRDDFDELFRDLGGRKSGNPELLAERMRLLDGEDATDPADVVTATGDVLAELDRAAIAEALGADPDPDDAAETEHRKDMEERRDLLVEALRVRACALLEMEGDDAAADFEETYRKLDRWSEMDTNGNARLLVERERRRGRPAVALQALNGRIEEDPRDRELLEMRSALLAELGWPEWVTHEEQWLRLRLPGEYPPF